MSSRKSYEKKPFEKSRSRNSNFFRKYFFAVALIALGFALCLAPWPSPAQSALEGRISETVSALIRIVNVIIAGFIVWSGFLIAKGEHTGFHRLIYGVVGLIVANASYLIINYFSWF